MQKQISNHLVELLKAQIGDIITAQDSSPSVIKTPPVDDSQNLVQKLADKTTAKKNKITLSPKKGIIYTPLKDDMNTLMVIFGMKEEVIRHIKQLNPTLETFSRSRDNLLLEFTGEVNHVKVTPANSFALRKIGSFESIDGLLDLVIFNLRMEAHLKPPTPSIGHTVVEFQKPGTANLAVTATEGLGALSEVAGSEDSQFEEDDHAVNPAVDPFVFDRKHALDSDEGEDDLFEDSTSELESKGIFKPPLGQKNGTVDCTAKPADKKISKPKVKRKLARSTPNKSAGDPKISDFDSERHNTDRISPPKAARSITTKSETGSGSGSGSDSEVLDEERVSPPKVKRKLARTTPNKSGGDPKISDLDSECQNTDRISPPKDSDKNTAARSITTKSESGSGSGSGSDTEVLDKERVSPPKVKRKLARSTPNKSEGDPKISDSERQNTDRISPPKDSDKNSAARSTARKSETGSGSGSGSGSDTEVLDEERVSPPKDSDKSKAAGSTRLKSETGSGWESQDSAKQKASKSTRKNAVSGIEASDTDAKVPKRMKGKSSLGYNSASDHDSDIVDFHKKNRKRKSEDSGKGHPAKRTRVQGIQSAKIGADVTEFQVQLHGWLKTYDEMIQAGREAELHETFSSRQLNKILKFNKGEQSLKELFKYYGLDYEAPTLAEKDHTRLTRLRNRVGYHIKLEQESKSQKSQKISKNNKSGSKAKKSR